MQVPHFAEKVALSFLALALGAISAARAQDPSINNWGAPPWQTADVWVDNDGDGALNEIGEPSRGLAVPNRLFARVRNLGSIAANNVTVSFAYAPYGLWAPASWADFAPIQSAVVSLGAAGSSSDETTIEVPWDLGDLSEDNGGAWGGFTVGDFDHFCVLVQLAFPGDTDTTNNVAQSNFGHVPLAQQKVRFLVKNPRQLPATAEVLVDAAPRGWRFALEGAQAGSRFVLQPGETQLLSLALVPAGATVGEESAIRSARGNVALRLDGEIVGGISFLAGEEQELPTAAFPPAGGVLGPYLIGTWDLRHQRTVIQIVNPTGQPLAILTAFFDADERPLACVRERLSANDLLEVDVRRHVRDRVGVVKVVALDDAGRPVSGVVGNQRQLWRSFFSRERVRAETALHVIPAEILAGDMEMIRKACP